jgi:hypothetical protein
MRVIQHVAELGQLAALAGRALNMNLKPENLNESELRSSVVLTNTGTISVPFNAQNKGSNKLANDVLLSQEDSFLVTGIGYGIGVIGTATPTDAQYLAANLHQYLNTNTGVFDGTNIAANGNALFNSMAKLESNVRIIADAISVRRLSRKPIIAEGQPLVYNGTSTLVEVAKHTQAEPNAFYTRPINPVLVKGSETLTWKQELGSSLTFVDASETYFVQVVLTGFLIRK